MWGGEGAGNDDCRRGGGEGGMGLFLSGLFIKFRFALLKSSKMMSILLKVAVLSIVLSVVECDWRDGFHWQKRSDQGFMEEMKRMAPPMLMMKNQHAFHQHDKRGGGRGMYRYFSKHQHGPSGGEITKRLFPTSAFAAASSRFGSSGASSSRFSSPSQYGIMDNDIDNNNMFANIWGERTI